METKINLMIHSFGFRFLKSESNLNPLENINTKIYDVRNLFDPFYIAGDKTGMDQEIIDLVLEKGGTKIVNQIIKDLESDSNIEEIWIGCKGGRHRSVSICETLKSKLTNITTNIIHHHIHC